MTFRTWWGGVLAVAMFAAWPAARADDEAPDENSEAVEPDESSASADAVFDYLVAEVAAQRGDIETALGLYHRMARELRDPAIARRAVELAVRSRAYGPALESSALLLELDPNSSLGREIMAALLANDSKLDKARETVSTILEKSPARGTLLLQLQHLFAKFPDKAATLEATRAGQIGRDVDAIAREVIAEAGWGALFAHGLGHGLGMEVHEQPGLRPESEDVLQVDGVVTVEPGIYHPGLGGIRIEDLVIVDEDGPQVLSGFTKELVTVS
jgi:tetratricopeptide (TPR) repeat protein